MGDDTAFRLLADLLGVVEPRDMTWADLVAEVISQFKTLDFEIVRLTRERDYLL